MSLFVVAALVVCAIAMAFAPSAFGVVYNPGNMGYVSSAPGYCGWWVGWYPSTQVYSPVPFGPSARWFNQPVSVSKFVMGGVVPTSTITPLPTGTYYLNGGPAQSFITSPTPNLLSQEGVYVLRLYGANTIGSLYESTSVVGVDRTRPKSWCDAAPVYDGSARVTITATDTLSGIELIFSSLDGASDMCTIALPASGDSAWVDAGVGSHVLTWLSIDNAGNIEGRHSATFAVNPIGFRPSLSNVRAGVSKRKVKFSGTVSPITSNATLRLLVERKIGGKWKTHANYFVLVRRYQSSWTLTKSLSKAGTFRVRAFEGTSASPKLTQFRLK
jgi:hypothetical protein